MNAMFTDNLLISINQYGINSILSIVLSSELYYKYEYSHSSNLLIT